MFLSLNKVHDSIQIAADELAKEGYIAIVVAGEQWDRLSDHRISPNIFLEYMVGHIKVNRSAEIPNIFSINKKIEDVKCLKKYYCSQATKHSSTFLRRHCHNRHDDIYVERTIDKRINEFLHLLKPYRLYSKFKESSKKKYHDLPKQLFMVRDLSGAGKTTLSVNNTRDNDWIGLSKSCNQSNIDEIFDDFNNGNWEKTLFDLLEMNLPLFLTFDSLDESTHIPNKKNEVLSIIRALSPLNDIAKKNGFHCFPIAIMFTIRDDFWRDWETIFEGYTATTYKRSFSTFTAEELPEALYKYQKAFGYSIRGTLSLQSQKTLSHPFYLQIFSEANAFQGEIPNHDLFNVNVLSLYFEKKLKIF